MECAWSCISVLRNVLIIIMYCGHSIRFVFLQLYLHKLQNDYFPYIYIGLIPYRLSGFLYHTTLVSKSYSKCIPYIIWKKIWKQTIMWLVNGIQIHVWSRCAIKTCINHAFLYYITIFFEMRLTWGNKFNKVLCLLYNYLNRCLINWAHWK